MQSTTLLDASSSEIQEETSEGYRKLEKPVDENLPIKCLTGKHSTWLTKRKVEQTMSSKALPKEVPQTSYGYSEIEPNFNKVVFKESTSIKW